MKFIPEIYLDNRAYNNKPLALDKMEVYANTKEHDLKETRGKVENTRLYQLI